MRATPELAGTNGKWGTVVKVENFTMSEPVLYTVKLDSGLVHAYPRHWLNPAVLSRHASTMPSSSEVRLFTTSGATY